MSRVDSWLQSVLWDSTLPSAGPSVPDSHPTDFDIHRLKGILVTEDGSEKIIQAVRDVFEIRDSESAPAAERKMQCKIVLIGRGLGPDAQPWQRSLEAFLERAD